MNNHPEYRRHTYRPPETSYSPEAEQAGQTNQLAHHADPSLQTTQPAAPSSKRIAWVRPTELPSYAGPLIGRGVDLQVELIRRARRSPVTATRAVRRHLHRAAPTTPSPREEGIGL